MLNTNPTSFSLRRFLGVTLLSAMLPVTAHADTAHTTASSPDKFPSRQIQPALHPDRFGVYVSNATEGTLSVFTFNEKDKTLTPLDTVKAGQSMAPQAFSPDHKVLYAVDVGKNAIVSFNVDPHTGALKQRQTTAVPAQYVYLSIDASGRYAIGASYFGDKVEVFRVSDLDKARATPISTIDHIPHAHSIVISPDARFVYVASLGSDRLYGFSLSNEGHLSPVNSVLIDKNFGPRHQYLSHDGTRLYVISEFSGRVAELKRDPMTGRLSLLHVSPRPAVLSHLQDGFADAADSKRGTHGLRWAADLHASPDEQFFYLSERTDSKIITLNHNLRDVGSTDTVKQPRGFNITPDGHFLIVSGERSPDVIVYQVNQHTGHLTPVAKSQAGGGANWVGILPLS